MKGAHGLHAIAVITVITCAFGLSSCSSGGTGRDHGPEVLVLPTSAPVEAPVWSDEAHALFGLTQNGSRIARIEPANESSGPERTKTTLSQTYADLGENVEEGAGHGGELYVPQPTLGQIAVLNDETFGLMRTISIGSQPTYVAVDSGSDHLLVLNKARSTVTPIDLHDYSVSATEAVQASPGAEMDASKRGRRIDFYLAGQAGITHYKRTFGVLRNMGGIGVQAESVAGDLTKTSRIYVAERGANRLLAIDSKPGGDGLRVVASNDMGAPVSFVGADQTRVYVATEDRLVVLKANSFEGYPDGTFSTLATIDFRPMLKGITAQDGALSGLAVGPHRVYLTLVGEPSIVSIAKPAI